MKRSFFLPMLCLGVFVLFGGCCGMSMISMEMREREASMSEFVEHYEDANDYDALFSKAVAIYEEANFYHSENTAVSASFLTLGMFLVLWAFEHRKLFKQQKGLKQQIEELSLKRQDQA